MLALAATLLVTTAVLAYGATQKEALVRLLRFLGLLEETNAHSGGEAELEAVYASPMAVLRFPHPRIGEEDGALNVTDSVVVTLHDADGQQTGNVSFNALQIALPAEYGDETVTEVVVVMHYGNMSSVFTRYASGMSASHELFADIAR